MKEIIIGTWVVWVTLTLFALNWFHSKYKVDRDDFTVRIERLERQQKAGL